MNQLTLAEGFAAAAVFLAGAFAVTVAFTGAVGFFGSTFVSPAALGFASLMGPEGPVTGSASGTTTMGRIARAGTRKRSRRAQVATARQGKTGHGTFGLIKDALLLARLDCLAYVRANCRVAPGQLVVRIDVLVDRLTTATEISCQVWRPRNAERHKQARARRTYLLPVRSLSYQKLQSANIRRAHDTVVAAQRARTRKDGAGRISSQDEVDLL